MLLERRPAPRLRADLGGLNGRARLVHIDMWSGAPWFAAVLAHEVRHRNVSRAVLLGWLALVGGLGIVHPLAMLAAVPVVFLVKLPAFRRWEMLGAHAIEVAAAELHYGLKPGPYLAGEARALKTAKAYAPLFLRFSQPEIEAKLRSRLNWARRWVWRRGWIGDWADRTGGRRG